MANPAARLTDDLIVEILSRLPVKSLCRCKCVSPHWRDLISDPYHRRRLQQTLAGFFLKTSDQGRKARRFANLCEASRPPLIDYPFSFVPGYADVKIVDSCNGLLLCRASRTQSSSPDTVFSYVVCNPATRTWHVLPNSSSGCVDSYNEKRTARLGFDPAVSLNFHVFQFVNKSEPYGCVDGVEIYSFETGAWSYSQSEWEEETHIVAGSPSVFFNGLVHLVTIASYTVVAVSVDGESWWEMAVPENCDDFKNLDWYRTWNPCFLGRYKGNLCYINEYPFGSDLAIWVLEDYAADKWILMHRLSIQHLTGNITTAERMCYYFFTIHPHCNWLLYVDGCDQTLMAYDMDHDEVHVLQNLGSNWIRGCIPYVPFYGSSSAHEH